MRTRTRGSLAVASLAVLAMTVAACGGSNKAGGSPGTGNTGPVSTNNGLQGVNGGGTPTKGGTLNMLGDGDLDYMDYNASYYTIGYQTERMWQRGLYAYPAEAGKTLVAAPDLATALPTVTDGGKTVTVTIRQGAMWNTSPARQVTAADVILGMKRACNPTPTHFGGLADYEAIVVGYSTFCTGFQKVSPTNLTAINNYMNKHQISGVSASGETLTIHLTQPAAYLSGAMTMDSFAPAPIESEKYLPGSAQSAQHMIADGPYQITSYVPGKSIKFDRNPAWQASSDPIRKAYVNAINITETGNPTTIQQVLQTNSSAGGMEYDAFPPVESLAGLVQQMKAGTTHNMNLGPTGGSNPYLVFNTISPNNNKALGNTKVRQAISMAINRTHLIQDLGGPEVAPQLTHILPTGIGGSEDIPASFDPFPYNPSKAKSLLKAAGKSGLTITLPSSTAAPGMLESATAFAQQARAAGVTINVNNGPAGSYFGTQYLKQNFAQTQWLTTPMYNWIGQAMAPTAPFNETHWHNPQWDSLLRQAEATVDAGKRQELYFEMQKILWNEGGYIIWGFYPLLDGLSLKVHGAIPNPANELGNWQFHTWWLSG